jgi:Arabinose-binding domain of AraC transcription regulator, N-term
MLSIEPILHPVVISQVIINFAADFGVDIETCLLGTGISEAQLQDGEALVSRDQEMRLIENLILALPDEPALGFRLGLQYNVSTFGVWGFALRTSRTLREAATLALRYLPLSTAYCRMQQLEEGEFFTITFDADSIPAPLRQFLLERDLATGINLVNELSLSGLKLSRIEFQGGPPDYLGYIETLFGCMPSYHSARNAFTVTIEEAGRLLPAFDPHMARLMDEQCRLQLQRRNQTGISGEVRQQILGP